jgi:hypothetical protein
VSDTTRAVWRFALGQPVRWAGDGEVDAITARRWVERELLPPPCRGTGQAYAEYAIAGGAQWEVEADLEALEETPWPSRGMTRAADTDSP